MGSACTKQTSVRDTFVNNIDIISHEQLKNKATTLFVEYNELKSRYQQLENQNIQIKKQLNIARKNISLQSKKEFLKQFDISKAEQIGKGAFGIVYLCENKRNHEKYALKVVKTGNLGYLESIQNEVTMYNTVGNHPNIIKIESMFVWIDQNGKLEKHKKNEVPPQQNSQQSAQKNLEGQENNQNPSQNQNNKYISIEDLEEGYRSVQAESITEIIEFVIIICMEYAEDNLSSQISLKQKTKQPFNDSQLKDIYLQILEATFYLQGLHIFHRDIKPGNILIVDGKYKLGDFQMAHPIKQADDEQKSDVIGGTKFYMSPQLLSQFLNLKGSKIKYNLLKNDVYALGITFLKTILLSNSLIKQLNDEMLGPDLTKQVIQQKVSNDLFKQLLIGMLDHNENKRFDYQKCKEILTGLSNKIELPINQLKELQHLRILSNQNNQLKITGQFDFLQEFDPALIVKIHQGEQSTVFKATSKLDGKAYALKLIETRDVEILKFIYNEIENINSIKPHKNLIQIPKVFIFSDVNSFISQDNLDFNDETSLRIYFATTENNHSKLIKKQNSIALNDIIKEKQFFTQNLNEQQNFQLEKNQSSLFMKQEEIIDADDQGIENLTKREQTQQISESLDQQLMQQLIFKQQESNTDNKHSQIQNNTNNNNLERVSTNMNPFNTINNTNNNNDNNNDTVNLNTNHNVSSTTARNNKNSLQINTLNKIVSNANNEGNINVINQNNNTHNNNNNYLNYDQSFSQFQFQKNTINSNNGGGVINYEQKFFIYIMMEYMEDQSLFQQILKNQESKQPMSYSDQKQLISDTLLALNYLNHNKISHQGIQPTSIFKSAQTYKISPVNIKKYQVKNIQYELTQTQSSQSPLMKQKGKKKLVLDEEQKDINDLGFTYLLSCGNFTVGQLDLIFDPEYKEELILEKLYDVQNLEIRELIKGMLLKDSTQLFRYKNCLQILNKL